MKAVPQREPTVASSQHPEEKCWAAQVQLMAWALIVGKKWILTCGLKWGIQDGHTMTYSHILSALKAMFQKKTRVIGVPLERSQLVT